MESKKLTKPKRGQYFEPKDRNINGSLLVRVKGTNSKNETVTYLIRGREFTTDIDEFYSRYEPSTRRF